MTVAANPAYSQDQCERDLELFRERMAEEAAKTKLGIAAAPPEFWYVAIANPDEPDKRVAGIASWDPRLDRTVVSKDICEALELPPASDSLLRRALLQVIGKRFVAEVEPADISLLCIVGKDLIGRAVAQQPEEPIDLSELFLDATARAHRAQRLAKAKTVLVIGSYKEGISRLRQIEGFLTKLGYDPVLLCDYPSGTESLEAKMLSFATISRFVIYEGSFPSGGIDEFKICKDNRILTAALREKGRTATAMQLDYPVDHNFIKFFEYEADQLEESVARACKWAEGTRERRAQGYRELGEKNK